MNSAAESGNNKKKGFTGFLKSTTKRALEGACARTGARSYAAPFSIAQPHLRWSHRQTILGLITLTWSALHTIGVVNKPLLSGRSTKADHYLEKANWS
jgi:hypothetical protein